MKFCLIRLDKIGDLACTLPVDEVPWLESHQIRWVISSGLGFLASHSVPGRRFLQLNKNQAFESFRALCRHLREEKFDVAVSFQAPWWVSLALWWQKVPVRAGVKSQWHSFLFFNRPLRQRRSRAEKHESDYNLDLLAHALKKSPADLPARISGVNLEVEGEKILSTTEIQTRAPRLRLRAGDQPDFWQRLGVTKDSYIVVHPGMAGSALNWSQKNYVSLIRHLAAKKTVLITGTPADENWLTEIRNGLNGTRNLRWLVGELTSAELLAVLSEAQLVVAPSTGIAHLAAGLSRKTLCFFSPVRVQRALRWSPRAVIEDRDVVCLTPTYKGATEPTNAVMDLISVEVVLEKIQGMLK